MKKHGASSVMADAHYRESVREHLDAAGISLRPAPEGQSGKAESYAKLKTLFREARVRLPEHERLARQIREVVGKPTSGGGMSIQSPVSPDGSHGDLVSALVLALYQASGHTVAAPTPTRDSPEYEDRLLETISRQRAAERNRPWWKVR
jgi:phage terminase large subunit-like protein